MIIDKNFSPIMEQVFSGRRLSRDEIIEVVDSIIDGTMSDVRMAAVLTGLRFLPASSDLIMGAIESFRKRVAPQNLATNGTMVDCSGSGADGSSSVNISTMAAVVACAAGAQVAKFGSRSVTSRCGSADVVEAIGVTLARDFTMAKTQLKQSHIAFLYAPAFYPALRHISAVRKSLGFHTIFDVLLPLTNPIALTGQLVGVYSRDVGPLVASALKDLGRKRALVVNSDEGLDEVSVCGPTYVIKISNGQTTQETWHPKDFGLTQSSVEALRGGGTEENARIFLETLQGKKPGAVLDAVLLNAAAVLWCAEKCDSVKDGLELAKKAVSSGAATQKLAEWQKALVP